MALCFCGIFLAGCASLIEVQPLEDPARVRVIARTDRPDARLSLALIDPATGLEGPAILGDEIRRAGEVEFVPRYPLSPGQRYRARLTGPAPAVAEYRVPDRPAREAATVEAIYPSADRLPANLLKFYIHFSRPMREGEAIFDRIRLVDDRGRAVGDPWRRVDLWTPDARRLTLYINPGRIKRGVNLREEFGPVLEPGRAYTLVLGAEIEDAQGQPLGRAVEKRFTAIAEDRERPSLESWKLEVPTAGSEKPLIVTFPESMDRWLVPKYLRVQDSEGRVLAGKSDVGIEERSWIFAPERPWAAGAYTLKADPFLEDLAGNTPARRFEEDAKAPTPQVSATARSFWIPKP